MAVKLMTSSSDEIILWLKANYQESGDDRIKCGSLLGLAKSMWPKSSIRQIGTCIRKAFPKSKRFRSNCTYYYKNLASINNGQATKSADVEIQCCIPSDHEIVRETFEVPRIFMINRNLIDDNVYELETGESSTLYLANFEGVDVLVKRYHDDIPLSHVQQEALNVCNLGNHCSLPLLLGIVVDKKPFLAVYKFYGSKRKKKSVNMKEILKCKNLQLESYLWIPIIIQIANGIAYLHENGYTHGDLTEEHIIVYKTSNSFYMKFVGLGNCIKMKDTDEMKDSFAFSELINSIYKHLDQTHPFLSYLVSSSIDNMHQVKPNAREIANKFNDIYENGYFNH